MAALRCRADDANHTVNLLTTSLGCSTISKQGIWAQSADQLARAQCTAFKAVFCSFMIPIPAAKNGEIRSQPSKFLEAAAAALPHSTAQVWPSGALHQSLATEPETDFRRSVNACAHCRKPGHPNTQPCQGSNSWV